MVEVRISNRRLAARENEVLKGQLMLQELKEAMVPVVGKLFPTGVRWGTLSMSTDDLTDDLVLQWDE
jgi:hypothetical protein